MRASTVKEARHDELLAKEALEKEQRKEQRRREKEQQQAQQRGKSVRPKEGSKPVSRTPQSTPILQNPSNRSFLIENLSNLSCYQISLRPPPSQFSLHPISDSYTQLQLDDLTVVLPGVLSTPQVYTTDGSLLRCSYEPTDEPLRVAASQPPASLVACRQCGHEICKQPPQRVLPLPSGQWDDLQDYLTCYPGQASIEFGTVHAQPNCLWFSDRTLVLHVDDANVVLLSWTTNGSGQARLGVAPVDVDATLHLDRYTLQTTEDAPLGSVAQYVAHSLIDASATQARFAAQLVDDTGRCLWLRLVSGDTCTMRDTKGWRKVAKILFYETREASTMSVFERDWCCPSPTMFLPEALKDDESVSFEQIRVDDVYWDECYRDLSESGEIFDRDTVDAVALAKLGKSLEEAPSKIGLAMIPLDT